MPTKRERFKIWRGEEKANGAEKIFIDAAVLFDDYIQDVMRTDGNLTTIKNELSNSKSKTYAEPITLPGRYTFGAQAYLKFQVDEALEALPALAEKEKEILTNLSNALGEMYRYPLVDSQAKVDALFENAEAFLMIEPEEYTDKKRAKTLYYSFFATFTILNTTFHTGFPKLSYPSQAFTKVKLNIGTFKDGLNALLLKVEDRLPLLNAATTTEATSPAHAHVVATLPIAAPNPNVPEIEEDSDLNTHMDEITEGITRSIDAKTNKKNIEDEITQVTGLLEKITDNDEKFHGREYFSDLVKGDEVYTALMLRSTGALKNQLDKDIKQLEAQSRLASGVLYAVSTIASPFTYLYRTISSIVVQDAIKNFVPDTSDSACKAGLKQLAKETLANLEANLLIENQKINIAAAEVSVDAALPAPLINAPVNAPVENLEAHVPLKTIQDHLNDRCLAVLNTTASEISNASALKARMDEITKGLADLMEAKTNKTSGEPEMPRVTARPEEDTDNEVAARDLGASLVALRANLLVENQAIDSAAAEISGDDVLLTALLTNASVEELEPIYNVTKILIETLVQYINLSTSVKEKKAFLNTHRINHTSDNLKIIVETLDGIGVRISNFLAKYISHLFKSHTAQMVDDARNLQSELAEIEAAYNLETTADLNTIEKSHIPDEIKNRLNTAFIQPTTPLDEPPPINPSNKAEARKLIDNLNLKSCADFKLRLKDIRSEEKHSEIILAQTPLF